MACCFIACHFILYFPPSVLAFFVIFFLIIFISYSLVRIHFLCLLFAFHICISYLRWFLTMNFLFKTNSFCIFFFYCCLSWALYWHSLLLQVWSILPAKWAGVSGNIKKPILALGEVLTPHPQLCCLLYMKGKHLSLEGWDYLFFCVL